MRRGARVVALLVALVGCSGRAEPAMDMMEADKDHRPQAAPVSRLREPVPMPEEPDVPVGLPP